MGRDSSLVSLEAKLDRLVALQEAANRIEAEKVEVLAAIAVDRDRRILADCPDEDGLAARVQELMALGDDNFVGVRLVTLSDPTAAVLVAPDGRHHRLSEVALGV